jgi:hypothetical protein
MGKTTIRERKMKHPPQPPSDSAPLEVFLITKRRIARKGPLAAGHCSLRGRAQHQLGRHAEWRSAIDCVVEDGLMNIARHGALASFDAIPVIRTSIECKIGHHG